MDFPGEKLVIKLWETLAEKGIGSLLSPWQIKREGKARVELRRHELLMLAQAELDVAEIRSGRKVLTIDGSLVDHQCHPTTNGIKALSSDGRIEPTLDFHTAQISANTIAFTEAARREINSTKAILFAEELLANDPQEPAERQVDEDWLFSWREYAGRVSNEDLQRLWGSILAGEIKSPGRHSVRTLEFLRCLNKSEADLIAVLASFVIDNRVIKSQVKYLDDHGLSFDVLLKLQELGVVSGVEAIGLSTQYKSNESGKFLKALISHDKVLIVEHTDDTKTLSVEVYPLTAIGSEVLSLGSFSPDPKYLESVGKDIASNGQGFTVKLADWKQETETMGKYSNSINIEPRT